MNLKKKQGPQQLWREGSRAEQAEGNCRKEAEEDLVSMTETLSRTHEGNTLLLSSHL